MKNFWSRRFFPGLIVIVVALFFYPFLFRGKIPIPADTILGLYHPWRDVIWDDLTAGVPYKNPLITDPVRQQYVWRKLAIDQLRQGKFPTWNPYSFAGTPLIATLQSASFYPLNLLFLLISFDTAWGILVVLQSLLSCVFMYGYLRTLKLSGTGSFIGAFVFAFSGFSIAWLEWNTVVQTILWLPLLLLCVEKIKDEYKSLKSFKSLRWGGLFIFGLCASFLAGHLQVFFYVFITTFVYIVAKLLQLKGKKRSLAILFFIFYFLFIVITSLQWLPTFRFIAASARDFDQGSWLKEGWFIPWQNIVQFVAPDFFGNPTTGNYWGVWNYAEFVGYIGIVPLILAIYSLFFNKGKKTLFFGTLFFLSLIFAFPTPLAKLPYILNLPLISTSQPTRLLSLAVFALAILSGLGFEKWREDKNVKRVIIASLIPVVILLGCAIFVFFAKSWGLSVEVENLQVAKKNLILPMGIFTISVLVFLFTAKIREKHIPILYGFILTLLIADLFRFGWKFTPFTKPEWIFPSTKIIELLQKDSYPWRVMAADQRIMAPNFSVAYKLYDVSGYDPLYLRRFGEFAAAWGRDQADISKASFNRILTPDNINSFLTDLMGVKYVLTLTDVKYSNLKFVMSEGITNLYENVDVFPRAFFVDNIVRVENPQQEIEEMFRLERKLQDTAVTSDDIPLQSFTGGSDSVDIILYEPSFVKLKTTSDNKKLLILTDVYYPTWRVYIDGVESTIYKVDFTLRGIVVPKGEHAIEFRNKLL